MTFRLRVAALALSGFLAAESAWALTYDEALDRAGDEMAATVGRQGLNRGNRIGIAPFIGAAGVACEPLASIMRSGVRRALIKHLGRMGHNATVVELTDPNVVDAVVAGNWRRGREGTARLTVKLGDVKSMTFADLGMEEVIFDTDSLPPDAQRCLLQYEPVERRVEAREPMIARSSPTPLGTRIAEITPGEPIWISARVTSEGGDKWFVVRLPDDELMPVGMRERRGFVYGLVIPFDPEKDIRIEELDSTFVVETTAKIRALPMARSEELARLAPGTEVVVTGKVRDTNWLRVVWQEGDAYVYGDQLKAIDSAELAGWEEIKAADDPAAVEAFLAKWPDGHFAKRAAELLKSLGPALKVDLWADSKSFRNGEYIRFHLKGTRDFHVTIVYQDAQGNLIRIIPNPNRGQTLFKGGVTHPIPDRQDRFVLKVSPPFGVETIYAYASIDPMPELAGDNIGNGLTLLKTSLAQIQGKLRGSEKSTDGKPPKGRSEASFRLQTRP